MLPDPQALYREIVVSLLGADCLASLDADVGKARKFGSSELKVNGRIFGMLTRGRLVVKLPKARVDALVAEGKGERFDPGHGRLMKEWLSVQPGQEGQWLSLASEAKDYVARLSNKR